MQLSFFDYALEYQGGRRSTQFLSEMKSLIPYGAIEAILIEKGIYKPNKGKQGRPSIPASVLVGALFLQSWYGLSDPMTEELIHDRISFRKFLDIKDEDTIPDETTICKFRNALIRAKVKKEKSAASVVTHHILHTTILFPFFGLLAGYFILKFLGDSLDATTLRILKDLVSIGFVFLGVKYSLSYIDKKYSVTNPEKSSKISIIVFGVLAACVWALSILNGFNIIGIVYNTVFFGIVFAIFFVMTKKYFSSLQAPQTAEA